MATKTPTTGDHLRISSAEVEANLAHYPEECKEHVLWVAEFIRSECNCSFQTFMIHSRGAGVDRKQNTWYQVVTGRYFRPGGSAKTLIEDVEQIKEFVRHGAMQGKIPFIETTAWHNVENFINALRAPANVCKMGVIAGDTGSQKTATLKEYQFRYNHGKTVRFEAPAVPSISRLVSKWLTCYSSKKWFLNSIKMENELRRQLSERKAVIIENAQRLYMPRRGANQEIFSFLQEIQEDTGCALILSWTQGFTRDFLTGNERDFFEQFVGRIGGEDRILTLPQKCPVSDLKLIAETLHVEDVESAMPILKDWAKSEGKIRILFSRLQRAMRYAQDDGSETIQLKHLEEANP